VIEITRHFTAREGDPTENFIEMSDVLLAQRKYPSRGGNPTLVVINGIFVYHYHAWMRISSADYIRNYTCIR
jgi:hypothetical protein